MRKTGILRTALTVLVPFVAAFLYACAHTPSLPDQHPPMEADLAVCSACHTDWRSALTHTGDYSSRHKFYAYQQQRTCSLCHSQSFCSDCHAHKEELKPSEKYREDVTRSFPHRGDYISQHQIDGRIYPTWCIKCHGRQNNERCRICHRS